MISRIFTISCLILFSLGSDAQTAGPNSPTTGTTSGNGADFPSVPSGLTVAGDGNYAYSDLADYPNCPSSFYCYYSKLATIQGFGFSIPSNATITGIKVEVKKRVAQPISDIRDSVIQLVDGGNPAGNNKASSSQWPYPNFLYESYGDSANLWGASWTPAQINDPNFGVNIRLTNGVLNQYGEIDHVQITIYYSLGSGIAELNESALQFVVRENTLRFVNANKLKGCSMVLFDLLGNKVVGIDFFAGQNINLSSLPRGFYLLRIKSKDRVFTKRLTY